jgi:hypothetical protein
MAVTLLCAPANAPFKVRGSSFDRVCSRCRKPVMLAPTGQKLLKKHPRAKIVCTQCLKPGEMTGKDAKPRAITDEQMEELKDIVPNTWEWPN